MLSAEGAFLGGCILPGVELMRFVLHEHTGRLPMSEGAYSDTPRNTLDAIEKRLPARPGRRGRADLPRVSAMSS
jgi:pantothenate kinase type III